MLAVGMAGNEGDGIREVHGSLAGNSNDSPVGMDGVDSVAERLLPHDLLSCRNRCQRGRCSCLKQAIVKDESTPIGAPPNIRGVGEVEACLAVAGTDPHLAVLDPRQCRISVPQVET